MPFIGQDWRSTGDQWVRTKEGWERLKLWRVKVFENLNSQFLSRLLRLALAEWDEDYQNLHNVHQPYIHYIRTTSREQKVLTSISEAFVHLDMSTAGKDLRRFNYVSKLIKLLLRDKLTTMSGTAQKHMFNILEDMVNNALKSHNNVPEVKLLVNFTARALGDNHWNHIGSSCLWNTHLQAVNHMAAKLRKFSYKERQEDGKTTFTDLPEECVRCIVKTMPNHADILRLSQADVKTNNITNDTVLWKQMCFFHFSKRQLLTFLTNQNEADTDWKYVYKRCYLRFGKKEVYADMLAICCHCNNIYWQSIGHPCMSELTPKHKVLKPEEFIALFQI